MDVPSPVSPEFTPGSLKLRSWTLSRKQHLVSNTATVSEQSEQLDIEKNMSMHTLFVCFDNNVFSSLLADSHHPVKCRHNRFLVTIVTTDHRKRHSSGAREATISWKLLQWSAPLSPTLNYRIPPKDGWNILHCQMSDYWLSLYSISNCAQVDSPQFTFSQNSQPLS